MKNSTILLLLVALLFLLGTWKVCQFKEEMSKQPTRIEQIDKALHP